MEWQGGRRSDNVDDAGRGGGFGRPLAFGGGAIGIVVAIVFYLLTGQVPLVSTEAPTSAPSQARPQAQAPRSAAEQQEHEFVSVILASTEDTWTAVLPQQARIQYRPPRLTTFQDSVQSACGMAQSAVGPFYCPGDEKLYLDVAFFRDLQTRFHAPGDFAQAYVIAHEVGHHVQKLTGTFQQMEAARGRGSQAEMNLTSERLELQADCYAGVWGHYAGTMNQLESGDIAEALNAATAIGDDRLQKQTQGRVVPESFTHGSSEQRVRWFKRGLESGRPKDCDTFSANSL